jgi:1,4-dihydroxy-6-naphthoate synthase
LRRSIEYSMTHRKEAVRYAMQWGRGLEVSQADRFIAMYVNDWTQDTGGRGRRPIEQLLTEAAAAGLIPANYSVEFV